MSIERSGLESGYLTIVPILKMANFERRLPTLHLAEKCFSGDQITFPEAKSFESSNVNPISFDRV